MASTATVTGRVSSFYMRVYEAETTTLRHRFIAFDIETTGLSPYRDRIIELGAVLFEQGQPTAEFSTLVNPRMPISPVATRVNHITDSMVSSAPEERQALELLLDFLGNAASGHTPIVAHNARFDVSFLCEALRRNGMGARIGYVDTLDLSRRLVFGVRNYRQATLANHFGIVNEHEHRATDDARTCGKILVELLRLRTNLYAA